MTSSKSNTSKGPPSNTITLGVRASTYTIWGDTDIQSVTAAPSSSLLPDLQAREC